jgi:ribonuclease E
MQSFEEKELMPKQIIIAEQHHIAAVFWEDQIQEIVVATGNQQVGDIYLGVVENVIPGIDAAFVNIGDAERNGFIHVTDLGPLRLKKTAGAITELLTPQQKVLVQVMKEPTGNKGPRLTGNITLPGRYLVLMPDGKGVKLSRRIKDDGERSRLRALAILIKPAGMGLLVRTEAEGKAEEAIMEDLEFLQKQWEAIQYQASYTKPPILLNRDDDFIQKVLRDMYSADVNTIMVDSQAGVKRVKQQLMNWSGGRSPQGVFIDYHRERQSILEYYRVNAAIREALKPRVELPSGGYIIIEPTEALTVIDVNSGSFTRSATARETVLWTNNEAATEIARQLRLRNIGGVIIVDFIDMDSRRDQLKLLEHFDKALKGDKARPQIAQLSELGLVELTRKRQGKNIYELFGQNCPTCAGLGHLVHLPGKFEGESLETPPINPPTIIPNPTDKYPQEEVSESPLDFNYDGSPQQLELLNHPNYQEQGGPNNRRRRRRRINDLLMKEDVGESEVTSPRELENEANTYPSEERKSRIPTRSIRREEINLEKVTVEMTELEQEVYALMGVSPLVRIDRTFKDPKSVLVYLKTPGQDDNNNGTATNSEEPPDSLEPTNSEEETELKLENGDASNNRRRRRRRSSAHKEMPV